MNLKEQIRRRYYPQGTLASGGDYDTRLKQSIDDFFSLIRSEIDKVELSDEELIKAYVDAVPIEDIVKHVYAEDCENDHKKQVRAVAHTMKEAIKKRLGE